MNKFSNQRSLPYLDKISVFESKDVNKYSKELYQTLQDYGELSYHEDPTDTEIRTSLDHASSMYFIHGHSTPSGTDLNSDDGGWFSVENLNTLDTPFFGADGCYVGGWWSDQTDNNVLDTSIDKSWYGSMIFTSTTIRVMVLGFLSQRGYSYPVSFLENGIEDLIMGATLAESLIGHTYISDNILVYGDPTFHY